MFHVKHEGSVPKDLIGSLTASREPLLHRYAALLREVAVPRKMIAASDSDRIWTRHVLDSLRGAALIPARATVVYDLGSGAGVPGVPVAIARPDLRLTLAEPRRERVAFLELVIEELGLAEARVHAGRAQQLAQGADVCLARAFRDPEASWRVAEPLLAPSGALFYWAGKSADVHVRGVRTRAFRTPSLAQAGPIVMMTRQ
jgi:16S rRNA (guanine527-N7)-methyltransferase